MKKILIGAIMIIAGCVGGQTDTLDQRPLGLCYNTEDKVVYECVSSLYDDGFDPYADAGGDG